jgi:hypothetical protein
MLVYGNEYLLYEDPSVDGMIILEWIFERRCGLDSTGAG